MDIKICPICGGEISGQAKYCPHCGSAVVATNALGRLRIEWRGTWMLTDTLVKLSVNGQLIGSYSFKDGFSIEIPISSALNEITIKYGFRTLKRTFTFQPHQNYFLMLEYSRFTGKFSFVELG